MKTAYAENNYKTDEYIELRNEYSVFRQQMAEAVESMASTLVEAQEKLSKEELARFRDELEIEDDGSPQFTASFSIEIKSLLDTPLEYGEVEF
jgi:hypothetical protein